MLYICVSDKQQLNYTTMTIRYANNFNKGEKYTDGVGQVWVYAPDYNQPDTSGYRFAYIMDVDATRIESAKFAQIFAESAQKAQEHKAKESIAYKMLASNVQRRLRKLGFKRVYTSKSGSTYYERDGYRVRISDHNVPMTEARFERVMSGTKGCANREIVISF
jgi:hypothetical protein